MVQKQENVPVSLDVDLVSQCIVFLDTLSKRRSLNDPFRVFPVQLQKHTNVVSTCAPACARHWGDRDAKLFKTLYWSPRALVTIAPEVIALVETVVCANFTP